VVGAQGIDDVDFVAADAARADFIGACDEVVVPTLRVFLQGNGQCPGIRADCEHLAVRAGVIPRVAIAVLGQERIDVAAVDAAGRDVGAPILAEQRGQLRRVGLRGAERFDERVARGVGCREGLLREGGRREGERSERCDRKEPVHRRRPPPWAPPEARWG
jgi:hypothetical protein